MPIGPIVGNDPSWDVCCGKHFETERDGPDRHKSESCLRDCSYYRRMIDADGTLPERMRTETSGCLAYPALTLQRSRHHAVVVVVVVVGMNERRKDSLAGTAGSGTIRLQQQRQRPSLMLLSVVYDEYGSARTVTTMTTETWSLSEPTQTCCAFSDWFLHQMRIPSRFAQSGHGHIEPKKTNHEFRR